jgi:PBSX family phage portal protein
MSSKPVRKGKVFIHTNRGALVPFAELQQHRIQKESSQIRADENKWIRENGVLPHIYPVDAFLTMYESSIIFARCVQQVAIDVTGLGWTLNPRDKEVKNQQELDRVKGFLKTPNPEESFRSILKNLMIDWGTVGWFNIEIVRNRVGDIEEIYRVPASTMYIHQDRKRFVQYRGHKKVWFKKFGVEDQYSRVDGSPVKGKSRKQLANEMIYYRNTAPGSDYYGVPNILPAAGDMVGLVSQRDYNLSFFANYGVPAAIVRLTGEWETGAEDTITKFLNEEFKGTDQQHRSLVIREPEEGKLDYTPLVAKTSEKEGSFRLYELARKENVLTAYSMPPERVGIRVVGKLGGNVAEEATKIYVASVVEPLQKDLEDIINDKILGLSTYEFKFTDIDTRDHDALIKRMGYQIERGMKTPNEARTELGQESYEEGNKFFMMSTLVEIGQKEDED